MTTNLTATAWIVNLFVQAYNVLIVIGALVANNYLIVPQFSSLLNVVYWFAVANLFMTALVAFTLAYHYKNKDFDAIKALIPVNLYVVINVIINVTLLLMNGFAGFAVFTTLVYLGVFYVRFNKIPE